jgi:hypothetical protein
MDPHPTSYKSSVDYLSGINDLGTTGCIEETLLPKRKIRHDWLERRHAVKHGGQLKRGVGCVNVHILICVKSPGNQSPCRDITDGLLMLFLSG